MGEHNAAAVSGALSTVPGVAAFWADFGVFGIDEVYNQQRLNDNADRKDGANPVQRLPAKAQQPDQSGQAANQPGITRMGQEASQGPQKSWLFRHAQTGR